MPILPKLIGSNTTEYKYVHSKENEFFCKRVTYQEYRLPISTDVLINGIALTITRCTFQEYKMRYNINSDEFDDLDKGYECVYNPYHIIFIPDIMAIDMFDL